MYKIQTQTPCGFLLVGAAFSSCLGEPIILRALPALHIPVDKLNRFRINYVYYKSGIVDSLELRPTTRQHLQQQRYFVLQIQK